MTTGRTEDYLETIYDIQLKKGSARVKDVAQHLGVVFPTVTEMFQKLRDSGHLNYEKYSEVTLTESGMKIARATRQRHDTIKEFLLVLGLQDEIAEKDACKMEHILSQETMDRFLEFLSFIKQFNEKACWLEHFEFFYRTGKFVYCVPSVKEDCPIHGKKL